MSEQKVTDQIGVQLSALMDGELPRDELRFLLRRIETDSELAGRWSRYQLVRGVLRRQPQTQLRTDFAATLSRRLAAEAAPARRRAPALLRWVGGGAIAASVAVAALVLTRPVMQTGAPALAAASVPTAIPDTRTPAAATTSSSAAPALLNFDYAQPASFEALPYGAAPYELLRRRYEPVETGSGLPYVLRIAPLLPQPPPTPLPERDAESAH